MRSSLSAFVSIGRLYCRQATATKFGSPRLTATCGNTDANFFVFLLMFVNTTPGVAPGSGGVCAKPQISPASIQQATSGTTCDPRLVIGTSPASKNELQRKLHNPWISRAENLTERRTIHRGVGTPEPRMVHHIKSFSPEVDPLTFSHREGPRQSDIEIPRAWPLNGAPAGIAE